MFARRVFGKAGKIALSAAGFGLASTNAQLTPAQFKAKAKAHAERQQFYANTRLASHKDYGKTSVTEDKVRELPIISDNLDHVHHLDVVKPMQSASIVVQSDMSPETFDSALGPQIKKEALRQMEQYIARRDLVTKATENGDLDHVYQDMFPPVHEPVFRVSNDAGGKVAQNWFVSNGCVDLTSDWIKTIASKHNLSNKSVDHLNGINGSLACKVDILSTGDSSPSNLVNSRWDMPLRFRVVGGYEDATDVNTALASRGNYNLIAAPLLKTTDGKIQPLTTADASAKAIVSYMATSEVADAIKGLDIHDPKTFKFQIQCAKTLAKQWTSASPEWISKQVLDAAVLA